MTVYVDYTTNQLKVEAGKDVKVFETMTDEQAKRFIIAVIRGLQDLAVAKHAL